jgi:hypothetical protein
MFEIMKLLVIEFTGEQEPSERSIKDDCAAILSMYSRTASVNEDPEEKKNSPFEELGLVSQIGNKYIKKRPNIDNLDPLAVLYLILEKLNMEQSLHIDYLTDGYNMPGKIFNLNRILVNEYLDELQNKGYIVVNRTAGLDIIYPAKCRQMQREDVVKEYYERGKRA